MAFGEKLQQLRSRKGMSQEQLADILGVSRQAVSKWERNETLPETEKVIRISDCFDVSLDYLLKDGPEQPRLAPSSVPATVRLKKWLHACDQYVYLAAVGLLLAGLYYIVWSVTGERAPVLETRGWAGTLVCYYILGTYRYALPAILVGLSGSILGFAARKKLRWYHICALPVLWGGCGLLFQEGMRLYLRFRQDWLIARFPYLQEWFLRAALGRDWYFTVHCIAAVMVGVFLLWLCRKLDIDQ